MNRRNHMVHNDRAICVINKIYLSLVSIIPYILTLLLLNNLIGRAPRKRASFCNHLYGQMSVTTQVEDRAPDLRITQQAMRPTR